ncbi:hapless 2 [Anthonomus grandis grandis]|uniref:hapless 2 n=1 Tax=Anthonomus grandis grandis TaxID=2921223 RepID=UPI002164FAAD|nr:hapless 2 [Anthonomus grandis grandis]
MSKYTRKLYNIIILLCLLKTLKCQLDNLGITPSLDQVLLSNKQTQNPEFEQIQPNPTDFELKAILTKCEKKPPQCDCENTFECNRTAATDKLKDRETRSKCDEKRDDQVLKNCEKKITLTLKMKNRGPTNCRTQFIVLDHVFDPSTDKKQKLLNPYVLKITQKPVFQTYDLLYENVVNSGPTERVINKNNEGFKGCNADSNNPTCGVVQFDNKEVPYSSGFCCSCLSPRSSSSSNDNIADPMMMDQNLDLANLNKDSGSTKTYLPEYNKIDYNHLGLLDKGNENDPNVLLGNNFGSPSKIIARAVQGGAIRTNPSKKRSIISKRGGQDCADSYVPSDADPSTYHDSAHCMDFSDVWYSIYKISHPDIDHCLHIQIYEKIGMRRNGIQWREVTRGVPIFVGTAYPRYTNKQGTILAYYTINKQIESEFALDCKAHKLLIPEVSGRDVKEDQYPEVSGGPPEYLVVKENEIDLSGMTCNKPGVGYEAFAQQPDRCTKERNTCLQNQPRDMWKHDHELETAGKKGCYFLKNYGQLPKDPIQVKACNGSTKKTQNKMLFMYYMPCLTSAVDIDFAADMNAILKPDTLAMITEVYTETLNPKRVIITAKILNSGLVTSVFYVAIGTCPMDVPASFGSITSKPVQIAPQQQHIFTLEIYCELPQRNFYCSLEVFNLKQQLIAVRRTRFERRDRCICVWHCRCSCFRTDQALKCDPLEIEQYHAAGFQGGMPIPTQVVNYSAFDDTISVILHIVLYFCLTLFYMGMLKAMIGCCLLPIGLWGLDKILDLPKKLNKYYERDLKEQEVVYDADGWPVHPETGKKVNVIAPPTQFTVNVVFFFLFPLAILWNLCKKLLAPKYSSSDMFANLEECKCRVSDISLLKEPEEQKEPEVTKSNKSLKK